MINLQILCSHFKREQIQKSAKEERKTNQRVRQRCFSAGARFLRSAAKAWLCAGHGTHLKSEPSIPVGWNVWQVLD
jgi:hypothetical protein